MSRTISTTLTSGITLVSGDNPVSITATGRITEGDGYAVYGPSGVSNWIVTNAGTIVDGGVSGIGVKLNSTGTFEAFTNQSGGLITSTHNGVAIDDAGVVINQANATIISRDTGLASAVYTEGLGTVVNAGLLQAGNIAVYELTGGTVTNLATGAIDGAGGIYLRGPGTVTNAGTIIGTNAAYGAVLFDSNASASRLIVDPGAVFSGKIISLANSTNVIELASSASAGRLSGFDGTSITNFATLQFDSGAAWTVAGNGAASGLGSIAITGFASGDTIDLTGFVAVSKTFASNQLVLTSASNAHATLHIQGSFSTSSFTIASDGATGTDVVLGTTAASPLAYGQTIDEAGVVATSETVDAGGTLTLFNAGHAAVGAINVGTSLSTGDFTLKSDGAGGTDVVVSSVFGTYTSGVTLLVDRTKVDPTAKVSNAAASNAGIYGPSGTVWALTNYGSVSETGAGGIGVVLGSAGTITNASGGSIAGDASFGAGVWLSAGGTVTNLAGGTISGLQAVRGSAAAITVMNAGLLSGNQTAAPGAGVYLGDGGTVTNQSGGTITGVNGVYAEAASATVVNFGSIHGSGTLRSGVDLLAGGTVINQSGGTISGHRAIYAADAPTVVNAGVLTGAVYAVLLMNGGSVTNQSGGTISAGIAIYGEQSTTVVNDGQITGITFAHGGSVTNQSGGTISDPTGIIVRGAAATILNAGLIADGAGLLHYAGVYIGAGGSVTNQPGGRITGFYGIYAKNTAATVVNAGSIGGGASGGIGVRLFAGGAITNQSGGTISGGGDSVLFAAGDTGLLVIDPGATFVGTADGANAIGSSFITTLELASGAATGTLTGLGTRYINFAQVTVDSGAQWTLGGTDTLVAGATLTNSGTLTGTGTLFNAGTITGNALRLDGGALTNQSSGLLSGSYVYGVAGGGTDTVVNQGTIAGGDGFAVYLKAAGNVSNAAGALISGYQGVKLKGANASLTNLGQITATGPNGGYGVYLRNGGVVTNGAGGAGTGTASIQGYYGIAFKSVDALNEYGTLSNYATVIGTGTATSAGVEMTNGGTVLNGQNGATAALIEGARYGVSSQNGPVTNDATIIATGTSGGDYGIDIQSVGTVSNLGTASLIQGYAGVLIGTDGTVTNAGTIASSQGTSGTAVHFTGGDARLVDDPGAVFVGGIYGGSGGTATFELASGSSAGTVSGFGGSVTNFTSLVFDDGSQWTVAGDDLADGLGTMGIGGFGFGDTIDLTGFTAVSRTFGSDGLVLTDGEGGHDTLHIQGSFTTSDFHIADVAGSTEVSLQNIPSIVAGGTASFSGGGSPVVLDGSLTVSDVDSPTLNSVTIDINGGFVTGDLLNFSNTASITGNYEAATGELTLTGTDTLADYQAALDAITYSFNPGTADPTNGGGDTSRTIQWVVNDGNNPSEPVTSTLNVLHVAPSIGAGGTVTFTGGGAAVPLDSGLTLADVDSNGSLTDAAISIGGFVAGDTLAFVNELGITGSYDVATGVLTLSGASSIQNYRNALGSISYNFTAGGDPTAGGSHTSRTIDWTVTDGSSSNGTSDVGTSVLDVVHAAPTLGVGGTVTFTGGGSAITLDSTASVNDPDSGDLLNGGTISIAGFVSGDILSADTTGLAISQTYNAEIGVLTLSGIDTLADYQHVLQSIAYSVNPADADPTDGGSATSRTIHWTVTDGSSSNGSASGTSALSLVHVGPMLSAGGTATFTGGGLAVALDGTVSVTDVDSGGILTGATVLIGGGFIAGDTMTLSGQDGISSSYSAATGVLTLNGAASIAAYEAALRSITYSFTPVNGDPTSGGGDTSRTIDWQVNDGAAFSNIGTSIVDTEHTAPTISVAGTATFTGGGASVLLDSEIGLTDPDSNGFLSGATVAIGSGFLAGDTLSFTNTTSITGHYDGATGVLTLSGSDTIGDYTAALESIRYSVAPSNDDPTGGGGDTSRVITWQVGDGVANSNTGTTAVDMVHVAPVITAGATAVFDGGGGPVVLDGTISIADVDSGGDLIGASIAFNSGFVAGDTLNFTAQNGIGGSYNAATGTLTLSGAASIANYEAALDSVTYSFSPDNGDPTRGGDDTHRTIRWTVNDGVASSNVATSSLTDTHIAPSITAGGTVAFATGGSLAVTLDPAITVSDPDSGGMLTRAVIAISGGFVAGDALDFVNTSSITGSYNPLTGVLVLHGAATIAAYDAALESITFSSTTATAGTRTISWNVGDGAAASATGSSSVDLTRLPPTIGGTVGGQATTDEAAVDPFSGVSIADPNAGQTETVTITLSDPANGTVSNLDGGVFNDGTYVVTGSVSDVTQAVNGLVFTPTAHQVEPGSSVTTTFTLQVTDSNGVSTTDSATAVVATAVNDPPTITQASINSGVPSTDAGSAAAAPFDVLTVNDPDVGHLDTVTVTMADPSDGAFSILSGGSYDAGTGVYSFTGSASEVTAALNALVFTASPPAAGTYVATTNFDVVVTGPGGTATDDAISVSTVAQQVPGLGAGASSNTISVSPDGSGFALPTPDQTNEAIVSDPSEGGTYSPPDGYQAEYLGGSADATLSDNSAGGVVLVGNSGNDTISAGAADDTLTGGGGNNIFNANGNGDIVGVTGNSTVNTSGSDDVVYAGMGMLTLTDSGTSDAIGLGDGMANVTLSGSSAVVFAGGGDVDLVDTGSGDAIGASTGMLTATLAGSGTQVYGGSGPMLVNVASTASGIVIGTGTGDATITVAGSQTTIYGGSGDLNAEVTGNNAVIGLDGGPASITLAGSAAEIFGGSGTLSVVDDGSADTIGAGTGDTTVMGNGGDAVVAGGGGNLQFVGGAGNATVFGGTGSTTVTGGSGATTLYGGAGGVLTFVDGSGSAVYQAQGGSETFNGAATSANLVLNGGIDANGHDVLIAGAGNDSLYAGTGTDTFTGGGGNNEFVFYKTVIAGAAPTDVITDFTANDAVYLAGYGSGEAANDLASASSNGGSTTLTLSDNTRITFLDVSGAGMLQGHLASF